MCMHTCPRCDGRGERYFGRKKGICFLCNGTGQATYEQIMASEGSAYYDAEAAQARLLEGRPSQRPDPSELIVVDSYEGFTLERVGESWTAAVINPDDELIAWLHYVDERVCVRVPPSASGAYGAEPLMDIRDGDCESYEDVLSQMLKSLGIHRPSETILA